MKDRSFNGGNHLQVSWFHSYTAARYTPKKYKAITNFSLNDCHISTNQRTNFVNRFLSIDKTYFLFRKRLQSQCTRCKQNPTVGYDDHLTHDLCIQKQVVDQTESKVLRRYVLDRLQYTPNYSDRRTLIQCTYDCISLKP